MLCSLGKACFYKVGPKNSVTENGKSWFVHFMLLCTQNSHSYLWFYNWDLLHGEKQNEVIKQPSGLFYQAYSGCNYVVNWKTKTPLGQVLCPKLHWGRVSQSQRRSTGLFQKRHVSGHGLFLNSVHMVLRSRSPGLLTSGSSACWLHSQTHHFKLKATHEVTVKPYHSSLKIRHPALLAYSSIVVPRNCEGSSSLKKPWMHFYLLRSYSFNQNILKKLR